MPSSSFGCRFFGDISDNNALHISLLFLEPCQVNSMRRGGNLEDFIFLRGKSQPKKNPPPKKGEKKTSKKDAL